jgi:dCTP deaminase
MRIPSIEMYGYLTNWLKKALDDPDFSMEQIRDLLENYTSLTGVVGDAELIAGINSGIFVIDPFDQEFVGSSSYDVRLGGNFWVGEKLEHQNDFSPFEERAVREFYTGPYQAITHMEWQERYGRKFAGIGNEEYIIVLRPGECILAHTIEFIGAAYGATTMMKAKSSLGRINISACDDAGWGDVGYVNRWTMEIRNKNREVSVPLVVGMPIAQMVYFWVAGSTINYSNTGHYQSGLDLVSLRKNWTPDSMLPQFYSDKNRIIRQKLLSTAELMF